MPDILTLLYTARDKLAPLSETASLDAQVLLAHILGQSRAWVLAHPEYTLTSSEDREFTSALEKLLSGVPLPYVLGLWEFYSLKFTVTPEVLIPRPETESLVETALVWLDQHPDRRSAADVGTGSGCIAVSLAVNVPDLELVATDISPGALNVARKNAHKHNVDNRIRFVHGDLLTQIPTSFDLICANLPYIPTKRLQGLEIFGKEPTVALDGGIDGLIFIKQLLVQASGRISSGANHHSLYPKRLAPGGLMLLETETTLGKTVSDLAKEFFPNAKISLHQDLAGHDRLVVIENTA